MYYPKGWARLLRLPQLDSVENPQEIQHVICNRDKILTALVTSDSIIIWYVKPCVPIISHRRSKTSVDELGKNVLAQWRPDSSMIVVVVSFLYILGQKPSPTAPHWGKIAKKVSSTFSRNEFFEYFCYQT